ncbi:MAG: biotin synthase BioB [Spirochaetaceae bacterium]|jgi:biotin synthase|nr:biotin synthase BioB [Spirochaetaceae bacterium]
MNSNYKTLVQKSLDGQTFSRDEALSVLNLPEAEVPALIESVYPVRKKYKGNTVAIQILSNMRSGNCSQDCVYCAQAHDSKADIQKYRMLPLDKLLAEGKTAQAKHISRHCIGISGIRFSDDDISGIADYVRSLKKETGMEICCSIGFLSREQAKMLKEAGVNRINHNLNTSRRFYPSICSTHTYEERIANIKMLQEAGFEICCGGIIGLGETVEDNVDMLFDLRAIDPESVPINFLIPISGTGMQDADTSGLSPEYCLKVLCLARLLCPQKDIRATAGRELYLKGYEKEMLMIADSIFASGYLTADGQSIDKTIEMVRAAGFDYRIE